MDWIRPVASRRRNLERARFGGHFSGRDDQSTTAKGQLSGFFWDDPEPEFNSIPIRDERISRETEREILAREQRTIQDYEERKAWRSVRLKTIQNQWAENRRKTTTPSRERGGSAESNYCFGSLFCCCMG